MAEHKVEVDYFKNFLTIDGEIYVTDKVKKHKEDGFMHIDKVIYRKATEKNINENIDIIVKAIKSKANFDEILRELVKDKFSNVKIKEIVNEIKSGRPIKKTDGCVHFKFGRKHVQLIG